MMESMGKFLMIGEQFSRWLLRYPYIELGNLFIVECFTSHWENFLPFTNELKGVVKSTNK